MKLKARTLTYFKYSLKLFFKSLFYFILFIIVYLSFAFILARIPSHSEKIQDVKNIEIYLISNGVHTDLVLPVKNKLVDWSKYILLKNIRQNDSTFNFIALGWGDKGFYLETPSWGELKTSTAFKAVFGLSTSAIHTTFYTEIDENKKNCVKIKISSKQYLKLINYVKESFIFSNEKELLFIKTNAIYGNHDAFYEANGNYNLFKTCNSWTNYGLKSCGQKACLWTPFQDGIFYHYNE